MAPATSVGLLSIRSPHRAEARDIECVHVCACERQAGPFFIQPLPFIHIPDKTSSPSQEYRAASMSLQHNLCIGRDAFTPFSPSQALLLTHMTCEIAMWHFYTSGDNK